MAENLHTESLKLLLRQPIFALPERRVLGELLEAATLGVYWDQLSRMEARDPNIPIIIDNITIKARSYGLAPHLAALKAHYAQSAPVQGDVPLDGADAPVQPVV